MRADTPRTVPGTSKFCRRSTKRKACGTSVRSAMGKGPPPCTSFGETPNGRERMRVRVLHRALAASQHDLAEGADVEARAADECAVNIRQHDQLVDVVRFHAAAVDDVAL